LHVDDEHRVAVKPRARRQRPRGREDERTVPTKKRDGRGLWRRVNIAQWRRVDWSLPNIKIAALFGCSPSLATIGRRKWGQPFPRRQADVFRAYLAANAKNLHGLPVSEVIRRSGCKIGYVSARLAMRRPDADRLGSGDAAADLGPTRILGAVFFLAAAGGGQVVTLSPRPPAHGPELHRSPPCRG
jgi:hypothetical protein